MSAYVHKNQSYHVPVLLKEVLDYVPMTHGDIVVDATVGGGGYFKEFLKRVKPEGKVIGIDRDPQALFEVQSQFSDKNFILVHDNFKNISTIVRNVSYTKVSHIVFDLGVSSFQIDESKTGISFQKDRPLDMRMDETENCATAADIVNTCNEKELALILEVFGEVRKPREIAHRIIVFRKQSPLLTPFMLVKAITGVSLNKATEKRDPLSPIRRKLLAKVFQALRIAVNDELGSLTCALEGSVEVIQPGGRIAVVSYHSLEDRLVKHFFKSNPLFSIITKKVMRPAYSEIMNNPRARSAKLRVVERKKIL